MTDWRCDCKKCRHAWTVRQVSSSGQPVRPDRCPHCGNPEWWKPMSRKEMSVRRVN